MTYRETLDFLYAQLPMYHRIGAAAFKKDLTNTLALCEQLGNPHLKFPCIHVGGTNGKGSVSHMLAAVCQAAGLKTGLYTSPHYKDFRERIKVNGQYVSRKQVVDFVAKNREAIESIQPSFFELCVAMAFDHFAGEKVDVAVIEVGLGGRLDSTNVVTPLISVITNISYDHQNMLGDTLPQIAYEKAGIIKPGVPVVIGETHPESAPVFLKKAAEMKSEIVFADHHFEAVEHRSDTFSKSVTSITQSTFYDVFRINPTPGPSPEGRGEALLLAIPTVEPKGDVVNSTSPLPLGEGPGVGLTHTTKLYLENLEVDAAGPYQAKNIAMAIQAVELLSRGALPLHFDALREGLQQLRKLTRFIGRWQIIGQNPAILCDSAHNEAGLRLLFEEISKLQTSNSKLHIITGFVNDKDVDKVLGYFPPAANYYFAKANIPRGLEATVLQEKAASFGLEGKAYVSVKNALNAAKRAAAPEDLILVTGSIFVVAEVL